MNDLLKSQFHENCRLALPGGLKDLMSDISREVLRAQPSNLYQFIAKYLEALLEARETLTIACQVCTDLCQCTCEQIKPELYNELRKIGLDEEDIENAIEVIENHLYKVQKSNESVKEQSLLLKLMRKTKIDDTQLSAIQQAVRKTIKRYSLYKDMRDFQYENNKESTEPVQHTLQLYNKKKSKKQNETKGIFVVPNTCLTTVSSTTLAGSYVELPKFRPYSAHDSDSLPKIPEKEHLFIDYTTEPADFKPNTIKTDNEKSDFIENHDKCKLFDSCNNKSLFMQHTKAGISTRFKPSKVTVSEETFLKETGEIDKDSEVSDVSIDFPHEESSDEVQESIENNDSENESEVTSIMEFIKDDIE